MSLRVPNNSAAQSPPSSTFSAQDLSSNPSPPTNYSSPQSPSKRAATTSTNYLPNQHAYYSEYLNKSQFNLTLINSAVKLLQILYAQNAAFGDVPEHTLRFFIIEILRRSKTSTQSLQLACFYVAKLIKSGRKINFGPKKLFLTAVILGSKFNQDHNYSFKSWLKICGSGSGSAASAGACLSVSELKQLEIEVLTLLDYELYLNNQNYENWCNILMIFGYDFIKLQKFDTNFKTGAAGSSQLEFETNPRETSAKFQNWQKLFAGLDFKKGLSTMEVHFSVYFNSQLGRKILLEGTAAAPVYFAGQQHAASLQTSCQYPGASPVAVPSLFGKRPHEEDNYIVKKVKV